MSQETTRGTGKSKPKKSKNKKKSKSADGQSTKDLLAELMTKEDEEFLRNVEDEDGECDIDFQGDGNEVEGSEISNFLKELGISEHRPFLTDLADIKDLDSSLNEAVDIQNENGEEMEIKQEDAEVDSKKKKKKKKKEADTVEPEPVKDEPEKTDDSVNKKKKSKKEKKEESEASVQTTENVKEKKGDKKKKDNSNSIGNSEINNVTEMQQAKEEKPDLKAIQAAMSYMKLKKNRSFLLLKAGELWREEKPYPLSQIGPEDKLVKEAEILAERLLQDDITHYTKQRENVKRSEARWLKTVLVSGTLADKIAALTLLIQESPVHNLSSIDTLITMAGKKGRREASLAIDTLRDLFITGLLPEDRKLRFFHQFPLYSLYDMTSGNVDQRDRLLLCWHFEDLIKKKYSQFIKILGEMLFDTLQATKEKAVNIVHHVLTSRPEQEHVLLPMLVNKMGDQHLNNKASYYMGKLVDEHPNMKGIVVKEICQLIYRPNVSQRAQYYAICFLTQIRLSQDESKLATELIKVYLSFFQTNLKKRVVDSKTMSALLTGVNRAYVYASDEKSELLGQMNEVYKIIPTVNFQTGVQALMMLYHVTENDANSASRFYVSLYRKLNDPGLASTTKHSIFLNLIFKSMKRDNVDSRIMAFVKRILQVYSHHPAHIVCGVLILLSQILITKPELYKSIRKSKVSWQDTDDTDIKEQDEEEKFVDLPIPDEFKDDSSQNEIKDEADDNTTSAIDTSVSLVKTSWIHRVNKDEKGSGELKLYDPHHRNPMYCKAELECIWELEELTQHFHPTVSLYANMLLKGESIKYNGDPLADYTLIRFLDRFVYKNPKKALNSTGVGAPQHKKVTGIRKIAVNSKEYLKQKNIPEDELFFYKYFTERERQRKEKEDDDDSVGDDEFDKYMDKFIDGRKEDFGDLDLDFAAETSKNKNKSKGAKDADSESDDDEEDDEAMNFEDDDDLAAEFEKELQGLENGGELDDDTDDDIDELDDDDENDMSLGLGDASGFNEEDVEFSEDENDPLNAMMAKSSSKGKKRKMDDSIFDLSVKSGKKNKQMDTASLFASAEEFSHLLEEGIDSGSVSLGGMDQMRNQDKAAQKQIAWEEKRDRWINDKGRQSKGKRKPKGKPSGPGGASKSKKFSKKSKR